MNIYDIIYIYIYIYIYIIDTQFYLVEYFVIPILKHIVLYEHIFLENDYLNRSYRIYLIII